jgi:hypothetical protein
MMMIAHALLFAAEGGRALQSGKRSLRALLGGAIAG